LGSGVEFIIKEKFNYLIFSGLAGYLPIHPRTYMRAWRNRTKDQDSKSDEKTT